MASSHAVGQRSYYYLTIERAGHLDSAVENETGCAQMCLPRDTGRMAGILPSHPGWSRAAVSFGGGGQER